MAFPNLSDIVATTIEARSREVADNVTNHNALLAQMKSVGGVKTFSGGSEIVEELSFAVNGNAAWYSGYDALSTAAQDVISAAKYSIKQAAVPVSISGLEMLQNSGREAFIDLLDARLDVAESTLKNLISSGIYSDGTGASGKQLTGLQAAVTIAPATGVYGGIDRATWNFWRNKKQKGAGTDFAGALTAANVQAVFQAIYSKLVRGQDKPTIIVADENYYNVFMSSLQPQQRFTDKKMAALGFDSIMFQSAPVVMESVASGISANTAYFLNTKYLKLRPHADRNMVSLDPKKRYSVNQDAETQIMAWAGNLTCSNAGLQGIVQD